MEYIICFQRCACIFSQRLSVVLLSSEYSRVRLYSEYSGLYSVVLQSSSEGQGVHVKIEVLEVENRESSSEPGCAELISAHVYRVPPGNGVVSIDSDDMSIWLSA